MADGEEEEEDHGEDHLHVGPRDEPENAQDQQLPKLKLCKYENYCHWFYNIRKRQEKVYFLFLMAVPLKALTAPPPPSALMAVRTFLVFQVQKELFYP